MWVELASALALVMVIEGLLPTLSPALYRRAMVAIGQMDDRTIRRTGLVSMVIGAIIIYLIRQA
jgi:uncharacterized protein